MRSENQVFQDETRTATCGAPPSIMLAVIPRRLWIGERSVKLTGHELDFITLLQRLGDRVLPRVRACSSIWGFVGPSYERRLDMLVKRLRDKLGLDVELIETVPGLGHRLQQRIALTRLRERMNSSKSRY